MNVTLLTAGKYPTSMIQTRPRAYHLVQLLAYLLVALLPGMTDSYAAEVETLESIRLSAERHALAQIEADHFEDATATAGSLDTRLQLKKCEIPLEAFSTGSMNNTSRMTVGVRCTGLNPWTLYVPVRISALVDVVFTSRALTRGALLTEEDLELQQLPLDRLPTGYVSDAAQIINFELTRPVNVGTAVTLSAVRPRDVVQQGQAVIITARLAGLQVKMAGEALKNGRSGDLIPVKNLRSGRTVEATIVDESTVSVNL